MFFFIFRISFLFTAVWLTACTSSQDTSGAVIDPAPQLVETFNVGRDVIVRSLAVSAADKRLLVGTTLGAMEVDLNSGELLNTWTRENALANEYVFAVYVDRAGQRWFGTNGGGISRLQPALSGKAGWKTWFPMHGLADYWVYSFTQQANGTMWIGTWAGLNALNPETGEFRTYLKELVNEWVYGLAVDSQDRLWVGTEGGVNMFDGKQWLAWTHQDGLGAPNVEGLPFSENTGLGTRARHDLNVMASGRMTYNPNYVFALEIDGNDHVWAATWGGGVSRFDGRGWQSWTHAQGLAGNIVYSLAIDDAGRIWAGTSNGLAWFDGQRWHTPDALNGQLPEKHVYALKGAGEYLWVGTRGGVTQIKLTTQ